MVIDVRYKGEVARTVYRTDQSPQFEFPRVDTRINGKKLSNLLDRIVSIQFSLHMGAVVQLMGLTDAKGIGVLIFHAQSAYF